MDLDMNSLYDLWEMAWAVFLEGKLGNGNYNVHFILYIISLFLYFKPFFSSQLYY